MDKNTFIEVLNILKEEYKNWDAPVVTFVAESSKDPYRVLISTLLSLRTKDETTTIAVRKLFPIASTPEQMIKLEQEELEKLIYPVGFYRNKAKQILQISKEILEEHNAKVPDDLETLLKFKGVGRKTANLVLSLGYKKPAICVDIHVHRISNRLGIVKTKTPEETEFSLMEQIPKEYWIIINDLLVAFGQIICRPISPHCSNCPIYELCERNNVSKSR